MKKIKELIRRPSESDKNTTRQTDDTTYSSSLTPVITAEDVRLLSKHNFEEIVQEMNLEKSVNPKRRKRMEALHRKIQLRINEKIDELQEEIDYFNAEVKKHTIDIKAIENKMISFKEESQKVNQLYERKNRLKYKGAIMSQTSEVLGIRGGIQKAKSKSGNSVSMEPESLTSNSYVYFNDLKDTVTGKNISLSPASSILQTNLTVDLELAGNISFRILGAEVIPIGATREGEATLYFNSNQDRSQTFNFLNPAPVKPESASVLSLLSPSNLTGFGVELLPNAFTTEVKGAIETEFSIIYYNPLFIETIVNNRK